MAPLLELRNVVKEFHVGPETIRAVNEVTLDIFPGDYLFVRGPSGSGKSVFLSLLGLLDQPSGGTFRVFGHKIDGLADEEVSRLRNRRIGMLFQHAWMLPRRTVGENVALPLRYRGVPPARALAAARDCLDRVGIVACAGRRAAELSGGQLQLACLARALVGEPDLIIADEPTASLDRDSEQRVHHILAELNASKHATIIHAAHRTPRLAGPIRDLQMEGGRIIEASIMPPQDAPNPVAAVP